MSARGPHSRRLSAGRDHAAPPRDGARGNSAERRDDAHGDAAPAAPLGDASGAAGPADAADDLLICRCEEVSRAEILAAIDEGVSTVGGLRRRLRIGMGLCQGRTCRRLLAQVLTERLGEQSGDVRPGTFRPPVRPVSLRAMSNEGEAPLPPAPGGHAGR